MSVTGFFKMLFDLPGQVEGLRTQSARVFGAGTPIGARFGAAFDALFRLIFTSIITCLSVFFVLAPALLLALIYGILIRPNFPSVPEGPVFIACAIITAIVLTVFVRFIGVGGPSKGVPWWQLMIGAPILAFATFIVGAWSHESVDRYSQLAMRRVSCVVAGDVNVLRACIAEFPNALGGDAWRRRLQAEADRLSAAARSAYEEAVRTYSRESFSAAKAAIEAMIDADANSDNAINQTRLRALARGPEEFSDCQDCPQMRVVLPPSESGIPFAIGVFETSVSEWNACVSAGACVGTQTSDLSLPVNNVTAQQVRGYLDYLSERSEQSYRLPFEGEWRLASSGQIDSEVAPLIGGLDDICAYYNSLNRDALARQAPPPSGNLACEDRFAPGELAPADPTEFSPGRRGHFLPNRYRLFHMVGNVSEWTMDSCETVWNGRTVPGRVVLGGSNTDPPRLRDGGVEIDKGCSGEWLARPSRGFRVARSL